VQLGINVVTQGPLALSLGTVTMAQAAEAAGADALWVDDHLLELDIPIDGYPYSPDGRPPWSADDDRLEALVACCFIAAATRRCRIGTAVLVVTQRNVLELAKQAATLDRLSHGRFVLGVGAGWNVAEIEALGYPAARRGERMDEMLDVLRECWSGRPAAFSGRHVQIPGHIVLHPRPVQQPGPPILVGGMNAAALRRAGQRGDGWLAIANVDEFDGAVLAEKLHEVGRHSAEAERPRPQAVLLLEASSGQERDVLAKIAEIASLGFDELVLTPPWDRGIDTAVEMIADASAKVKQQASGAR
jgi:probable F420-dependent oxidoreductase